MLNKVKDLVKDKSPHEFFYIMLLLDIVLMFMAGLLYSGRFQFWNYPLSYLGAYYARNGAVNSRSFLLYDTSMIINGILMLLVSYCFYFNKYLKRRMFKAVISFICGLGFIIAISPDDLAHPYHVLGSSLAVAGLWILSMTLLSDIKSDLKKYEFYLLQAILQIPIFTYAATYFLNLSYSSFVQKIAVLGLVVTLIASTKVSSKDSLKSMKPDLAK
jgi:hypothetical membrane protein